MTHELSVKFSAKKIPTPRSTHLFYVVAIFYQKKPEIWRKERGGNRAELIIKGENLYYNMPPQIDSLACGHIKS